MADKDAANANVFMSPACLVHPHEDAATAEFSISVLVSSVPCYKPAATANLSVSFFVGLEHICKNTIIAN